MQHICKTQYAGGEEGVPTNMPRRSYQHTAHPFLPHMALLFGKVRTLHVDIKGHLEDLLELRSVKDWMFTGMAAL